MVRGICGLKPQVKGLSENVTVRSLLGRFLEHSRVFYFKNAPKGQRTFLGSPDWMPRNFFRRVEIAFPVEEEKQEAQILQMLDDYMADNKYATELKGTGRYLKVPRRNRKAYSVQESLIEESILAREKENLGRASGKAKDKGEGDEEYA